MITRKTQRGIMVLVILTLISFWVSRGRDKESPNPVAGLDPKLNYVLHDFELQFFDDKGLPTMNLQAPLLRNNPQIQLGTIENPVIKLQQSEMRWNLWSDSATITTDKEHVQLLGPVFVQRQAAAGGRKENLTTRDVRIEVNIQTARTTNAVSIFDGINFVDAVGMYLDMKNGNIKLNHQVKARYAIE